MKVNKKIIFKNIFLGIFSIAFALFVSASAIGPDWMLNIIEKDTLNKVVPFKEPIPKEKDIHYYFTNENNEELKVSAKAYLIGDLDTGEVILTKNEKNRYPIASVSKLMTAYVSKELLNEEKEEKALVSKKALETYGKNGDFRVGENLKITDLWYSLLLQSSNDAAEIIAEHFERDSFLQKMNEVASVLELKETSFEDPSGLSRNNQSTVSDLFKFVGYVWQKSNDLFKITTNRSYSIKNHNWSSNNQFLKKTGYLGGKSGYTDPAKQTVVSLFSLPLSEEENKNIGIVLLQSDDRYKDVEKILAYLAKNIYYGEKIDTEEVWVQEKAEIPEIKEPDFVTLLFAGDMMLDRGVESSVMKNFNGDFATLFENMEILKEADITFANLEGPASLKGTDSKNLYSFRMAPTIIPALKGAGIGIVSVANNHMGDWGKEAFTDTLDTLEENEIFYVGGGQTRIEAEDPVIIEKYNIKLGFLGFSDVGPDWLKATDAQAGILSAKNPRLVEIINNASNKVDYLIVSFHFGDEYKTVHNQRQEYLAKLAIDSGAKIVIGHHPHVIQDTEVYKNGYIAYSLGNFIFDQGFSENTMKGMLLEMKLGRDGSISIKKNISEQNKQFKPEKLIIGKEEKLLFSD